MGTAGVRRNHLPGTCTCQVAGQLTELLSLRSCRFQYGVAGLGSMARLLPSGEVVIGDHSWKVESYGLPQQTDTELLVRSSGVLQGRFVMSAEPGARPTLERRLVAVAFADQVGAALTGGQSTEP